MKDAFPLGTLVLGLVTVFAVTILCWKIIDSSMQEAAQRLTGTPSGQGSSNTPIKEREREKPDEVTWSSPG